jgi:hypothetical protein
MPLPKFVASGVCAAILGLQLWVSFPVSKELRAWYWPFLPYPMYATARERDDYFLAPELRVARCGSASFETVLRADQLGTSTQKLNIALVHTAKAPTAPASTRTEARLSGAIEAQFPGRFCAASSWVRTVSVSDTSTHHAFGESRMAASWSLRDTDAR